MRPSDEIKEGDTVNTPYGTAEVIEVSEHQVVVRMDDGREATFFKANVEAVVRR